MLNDPAALSWAGAWGMNVVSSVGIIMVNKALMTSYGFAFATSLTALHFITTTAVSNAATAAGALAPSKHVPARTLLWFAFVASLAVVSMNVSLMVNSVGFYQITKLSIIPACCLFEALLHRKTFSPAVKAAVVGVMVGVGICTVTDVTVNTAGLLAAIVAVLSTTFQQIFIGSLQKQYSIGSFDLLSKTAPYQAVLLVICGPTVDYLLTRRSLLAFRPTPASVAFIVLSCVLALFVNLSMYLCIGKFSAVSFQVLGHMKTLFVLVLGSALFHSPLTAKNLMGMAVAVLGMLAYSWAVEREKAAAAAAAVVLPVTKQQQQAEEQALLGVAVEGKRQECCCGAFLWTSSPGSPLTLYPTAWPPLHGTSFSSSPLFPFTSPAWQMLLKLYPFLNEPTNLSPCAPGSVTRILLSRTPFPPPPTHTPPSPAWQMLLEPDPFLNELTKLYERHKGAGTVWVTLKRSNLRKKPKGGAQKAGADDVEEDESSAAEYRCVVRATDGKRKISTLLGPREHAKFQAAYALVLKAHMDSLKRKEKRQLQHPGLMPLHYPSFPPTSLLPSLPSPVSDPLHPFPPLSTPLQINFCVLVPRLSAAIISAQAGAFEASSLVLFLLGLAVTRLHLPLSALSLAYSLVPLALAALAAAAFPNSPFGAAKAAESDLSSEASLAHQLRPSPWDRPLHGTRSPLYWVHVAVSAYLVLRSNFFIAAVNTHIRYTVTTLLSIPPSTATTDLPSDAAAQITRYIDIFNIVLAAGGVLAVPLAGWSMERPGLPFSFALTTLLCALCSAVQMMAAWVPLPMQLVAFLAFAIARAFIYSTMATYIGTLFGFRNFGRLYGINRLGGAFLTLLQYPLTSACESSMGAQFVLVNGLFLAIELILTATFPYYLSVAMYGYFWRPLPRVGHGK
ncbi:unnamed protein product [Closterium sp. Yama58-4]|nr:unnamed protein product [Closterium sp. Yama58-4]